MPIVSSQYWNSVHGFTPSDVRKDKEGLQTMRTLGQNMVWLLKCIESGRKNGIEKPVYEPRVRTHFIKFGLFSTKYLYLQKLYILGVKNYYTITEMYAREYPRSKIIFPKELMKVVKQ